MSMEASDKSGGPIPHQPASKGETSTAGTDLAHGKKFVSTGSEFVRTGEISMEDNELQIAYDSFGKSHEVFIISQDLRQIIRSRLAPAAPVYEMRDRADGRNDRVKIGYGARTVSGKAFKVSTTTSGGDLLVPWSTFLKVVNGSQESAVLSRLNNKSGDGPRGPVPSSDGGIREGLAADSAPERISA